MLKYLIVLATLLLTACSTIQINESAFIHPDKPGTPKLDRFDGKLLAQSAPEAVLQDESVIQADGNVSNGYVVRQPKFKLTVFFIGGGGSRIDKFGNHLSTTVASCQTNVAAFDLRGHGRTLGKPSIDTIQSDALAIFDHLNAQTPGQVVVHGHSVGSFIAAYVAQHRPVKALVLESAATNPQEWADANVPWYAAPFVNFEIADQLKSIDNRHALAKTNIPTLLLVGLEDKVTPPALSQRLFAAIPGDNKQLILVPGAKHENVLLQSTALRSYCNFVLTQTTT